MLGACANHPMTAEVIRFNDFGPAKDGMTNEMEWKKVIHIGHNLSYPASILVTNKGNGILEFANLKLHVYDGHDDGRYFDGGLAHVEFVDLNDDGYKDIVVTAAVVYTDEKDKIIATKPALFVYYFDPKTRSFFLKYKVADFDLDR